MDFSAEVDALLQEKQRECLDNAETLMDIFRKNYDSFEKVVDFYKRNKKFAKRSGESAYSRIQSMLLSKGVTAISGDPVSLSAIGNYMNSVRNERMGKKRSRAEVAATSPHVLARQRVAAISREPACAKLTVQVAEIPGKFVAPEPVQEMVTDSVARLAREEREGFVVGWSGQDEYFLMNVLFKGYEEYKSKTFDTDCFWNDIKKVSYKFKSETYRPAARSLEMKLKKHGLWQHYELLR